MPRPKIKFDTYLRLIPQHVSPLTGISAVPISHYARAANDSWNLLLYIERNLKRAPVYGVAAGRHLNSLRVMVLLSLMEAFERFLKEEAAVCIDQIGRLMLDDRLDVFKVGGDKIALHFNPGGSLGRALCESQTWCDCDSSNQRFRSILADPFEGGRFYIFPRTKAENPAPLHGRYELMSILWQVRHSIVHNRGVLTASDAQKLRVLSKTQNVTGPAYLQPTHADVWYAKLFLDETAGKINEEIAKRLAELLGTIHQSDSTLIEPEAKAQELADVFKVPVTIVGHKKDPS